MVDGEGEDVSEHEPPRVVGGVLAGHEAVDTLGYVFCVEGAVARLDAFALDDHIRLLVSKLVQELQSDVDSALNGRVRRSHVVDLEFSLYLEVIKGHPTH